MGTSKQLMTQTAFAAANGYSQPYISKLVKAGKIPTMDGKIDVAKAGRVLAKLKRQPSPHKEELRYQNARLAQARADGGTGHGGTDQRGRTGGDHAGRSCRTRGERPVTPGSRRSKTATARSPFFCPACAAPVGAHRRGAMPFA